MRKLNAFLWGALLALALQPARADTQVGSAWLLYTAANKLPGYVHHQCRLRPNAAISGTPSFYQATYLQYRLMCIAEDTVWTGQIYFQSHYDHEDPTKVMDDMPYWGWPYFYSEAERWNWLTTDIITQGQLGGYCLYSGSTNSYALVWFRGPPSWTAPPVGEQINLYSNCGSGGGEEP